jgi:murein DD-endopeptidase MepM/ murein hydrolase activator NlpD
MKLKITRSKQRALRRKKEYIKTFPERMRYRRLRLKRSLLLSLLRTLESPKRLILSLGGITAVSAGAVAIALFIIGSQYLAVSFNDKVIGYVKDEAEYNAVLEQAKQSISREYGDAEVVLEADVQLRREFIPVKDDVTPLVDEDVKGILEETSSVLANAWFVRVDDNVRVKVATEDDAKALTEAIEARFAPADPKAEKAFFEKIDYEAAQTRISELKTVDEAVEVLLSGGVQQELYTVQEGDTAWDVGQAQGLSQEQLAEANPGLDLESLYPGDELKLKVITPFVHYQTKGIEEGFEPIPFEVIEEKAGTLYEGQSRTKTEGVQGERYVTRDVTRVNGEVTEAAELASSVTKEPSAKVVQIGTKKRYGATGRLGRPLNSYTLTQAYRGGGHSGLDMAAPTGTPIYAADGGIVSFAGSSGSYGNYITINHGNGMTTSYGHCNSINVRSGQTVAKGQQIGTVGSTGRSTGPHLHFEVTVGGSYVNPANYI